MPVVTGKTTRAATLLWDRAAINIDPDQYQFLMEINDNPSSNA
jgi:uncharacterized protein (DUF1778 family)